MNVFLGHESFGVYERMALTAFDLLSSVVAALFSAHPLRYSWLAIRYMPALG